MSSLIFSALTVKHNLKVNWDKEKIWLTRYPRKYSVMVYLNSCILFYFYFYLFSLI